MKTILPLLAYILLSSCFSLDHENSWNQRYSSYTEKPKKCKGTIPIVVHWGSGWHTSIVLPNKGLLVSQHFKDFPFLEINWGDKGFYQAGSSEIKQKLAAPKALLMPSESVMYIVGVAENNSGWCDFFDKDLSLSDVDDLLIKKNGINKPLMLCSEMNADYGDLFQYYDARQIWITPDDFTALTKRINQSFRVPESGQPIDLGNGYLFDPAYSTAARFFESSESYFGMFYTCNSWTAEILSQVDSLQSMSNQIIYRSEPIFEFLERKIASGDQCIRKFE